MARKGPAPKPGSKSVTAAAVKSEIVGRRALHQDPEPQAEPPLPSDPALQPRKVVHEVRRLEQLRKTPYSLEAEQAVLGAIMLEPDTFWPIASKLKEEDFYRRDHQLIYRAIGEMAEKQRPYDSVTLGSWFEENGMAESVDSGYLVDLSINTPSAANAEAYADIVIDKAQLRRLIEAGTHLVNAGFEPEGRGVDEIASKAVADIEASNRQTKVAGMKARAVLSEVMTEIQRRYEHNVEIVGLSTPWPDLTEMLGGLQPGRVYVVGGRAKMGKSIMLGNIATHAALAGHAVGVWHLEMPRQEAGLRMLSEVSEVEHKRIERARLLEDDHWSMLSEGARRIAAMRMTMYDEPGVTVEKISAQATMLKARGELELAVVDYLQIVKSVGGERRDLDIGHVSLGLKNLAKRLDVPVVVGAQINRGSEQGGKTVPNPPKVSNLRESGSIEQDVDAAILIHRPGYYTKDNGDTGTRVEVAINRSGETGIIRLEADLIRSRFRHSNQPWFDGNQSSREPDDTGGFTR